MKDMFVLLIEDDMDDEWLALRTLKMIGMKNVTVARDGMTALTMLLGNRETGERALATPDLIILDLALPKIHGIDVLREIRSNALTSATRVLVLTSSNDPNEIDVCKKLGVLAFFSKPLNGKALLNLI